MENILCPTTCFGQHRPLRILTLEWYCYIVLEPRFNIDMMMMMMKTVIICTKYKLCSYTCYLLHSQRSFYLPSSNIGWSEVWVCLSNVVTDSSVLGQWVREDRLESNIFGETCCFPLLRLECHRTANILIQTAAVGDYPFKNTCSRTK